MPKYLRNGDVSDIERVLDSCMDHLKDRGMEDSDLYETLFDKYNNFSAESNTSASLNDAREAVELFDGIFQTDAADALNNIVTTGIRAMNYPGSWNQAEKLARDTYRGANPGTPIVIGGAPAATWRCPGAAGNPAHDALFNDCTIDHVIPVVQHWNNLGHDMDAAGRAAWYRDTTNHEYLCQACNSAKGGGGQNYRILTGPNYSN